MRVKSTIFVVSALLFCFLNTITTAGPSPDNSIVITEADCTAEKLGSSIPVSAIGEPVSGISLKPPVWTKAAGPNPGYCIVDGSQWPRSQRLRAQVLSTFVLFFRNHGAPCRPDGRFRLQRIYSQPVDGHGYVFTDIPYRPRVCNLWE